jgi:hypothetical protein
MAGALHWLQTKDRFEARRANTIRMQHKNYRRAIPWRSFAILIAIFFAMNRVLWAQAGPSESNGQAGPSVPSDQQGKFTNTSSSSILTPLKPQLLDAPYRPITPQESFRWFITSTIGLPHRVGAVFLSAAGTALDRPPEYGPHWGGFADRYGMRLACSATGNLIEAGAGLILREDPRYFRVPDRPLNARIGNALKLGFTARGYDGRFRPAYARYMAAFGNSFLSNTWRVDSEANVEGALVRTAGDFAGRMTANAWDEFWPDVKKRLLHKRN